MRGLFINLEGNHSIKNAFSLVEIVIVIAVLSVLSAISLPNILNTIKSNRIEEAKILMDSYAAECLKEFRLGKDLSTISPLTFSEKKINALGFKKSSNSKCNRFSIEPSNINDNLYFQMDFRIGSESGTLVKTATPSSNSSGSNACELWAGDLCTTQGNLKTNWDNIFDNESKKAKCEEAFFSWRNSQPSGKSNRWDDSAKACSKKVWVHKIYITDSEAKYQEIKKSEECSSAKNVYATYTGEKYIPSCEKTFYFYNGIDMGSKNLMQGKLIEDNEIACKVNRENKN